MKPKSLKCKCGHRKENHSTQDGWCYFPGQGKDRTCKTDCRRYRPRPKKKGEK